MVCDEIICGDNVAVLSTFPDACIDLVVTSPPYDNLRKYGWHSWDFEGVAAQLVRVIKQGGVIVWVVADATVNGSETGTSMRQALYFKDACGLNLHDTMIWNKPPAGANGSVFSYSQSAEFMFVMSKGKPKSITILRDRRNVSCGSVAIKTTGGRWNKNDGAKHTDKQRIVPEFGMRTNVWDIAVGGSAGESTIHPACFPEALARDHVLSWSNEGDTVLDPFNGSGTTTKMAREFGRHYIGIDVEESYCAIARKRLEQGLLFSTSSKEP